MHKIVNKITSGGRGIGKHTPFSQNIQPGAGGLIKCPSVNDVISGRGGRISQHLANLYYRTLVNKYKHKYIDKRTKKLDKVKIANHIVMLIRSENPPGRFLKQDTDTKYWKEIGDFKAGKKVGQAMREKSTETRRNMEERKVTPLIVNNGVDAPASAHILPLANSPNHISNNPVLMPATYHTGVIPTPVNSHPRAIPERVASYPPAGGYPHEGPISYSSNNFPGAEARLDYILYDQAVKALEKYDSGMFHSRTSMGRQENYLEGFADDHQYTF